MLSFLYDLYNKKEKKEERKDRTFIYRRTCAYKKR